MIAGSRFAILRKLGALARAMVHQLNLVILVEFKLVVRMVIGELVLNHQLALVAVIAPLPAVFAIPVSEVCACQRHVAIVKLVTPLRAFALQIVAQMIVKPVLAVHVFPVVVRVLA